MLLIKEWKHDPIIETNNTTITLILHIFLIDFIVCFFSSNLFPCECSHIVKIMFFSNLNVSYRSKNKNCSNEVNPILFEIAWEKFVCNNFLCFTRECSVLIFSSHTFSVNRLTKIFAWKHAFYVTQTSIYIMLEQKKTKSNSFTKVFVHSCDLWMFSWIFLLHVVVAGIFFSSSSEHRIIRFRLLKIVQWSFWFSLQCVRRSFLHKSHAKYKNKWRKEIRRDSTITTINIINYSICR